MLQVKDPMLSTAAHYCRGAGSTPGLDMPRVQPKNLKKNGVQLQVIENLTIVAPPPPHTHTTTHSPSPPHTHTIGVELLVEQRAQV